MWVISFGWGGRESSNLQHLLNSMVEILSPPPISNYQCDIPELGNWEQTHRLQPTTDSMSSQSFFSGLVQIPIGGGGEEVR